MKDENKTGPIIAAATIGAVVGSAVTAVLADQGSRNKAEDVIKKTFSEGEKTMEKVKKNLEEAPEVKDMSKRVSDVVEDVKKSIKENLS